MYFWEFSVGLFVSQSKNGIWLSISTYTLGFDLEKDKSNEKKIPLSLGMLSKKRRSLVNKSFLDNNCSDLSMIFYTILWHVYFGISFVWLPLFGFFFLCSAFFGSDSLVLGDVRSSKKRAKCDFSGPSPLVLTKAKWSSVVGLDKQTDMAGWHAVCNIVSEEGYSKRL